MEVCFLENEEKAFGLAKMLAALDFQNEQGLTSLCACIVKRKRLVTLFL